VHNEVAKLVAIDTYDDDGCLSLSLSIDGRKPNKVRMGGHVETVDGLGSLLGKDVVVTISVAPAEDVL
jgi:hypothetical protein